MGFLVRTKPQESTIPLKRLIVFDLDGTLADSKSPVDREALTLLHELLGIVKVAVISGGDWPQFKKQLLSDLPSDECLSNLFLLPTCGTKFFLFDGVWKKLYSEDFLPMEKTRIMKSLEDAVGCSGFKVENPWGETTEDRGSQISFSALGQRAPLEEKAKWDPTFIKRKQIKAALEISIPEFSIRMGGTTSIDITKAGIDKAYGIRKLRDILGIPLQEMMFVGDALFAGGNDYPVAEAGVDSIAVGGPAETKPVIQAIVACLSPASGKAIKATLTA